MYVVSETTRLLSTDSQLSGGKVHVHTWTAATSRIANAVWLTAVAQHQFHLDCKHNKVGRLAHVIRRIFLTEVCVCVRSGWEL